MILFHMHTPAVCQPRLLVFDPLSNVKSSITQRFHHMQKHKGAHEAALADHSPPAFCFKDTRSGSFEMKIMQTQLCIDVLCPYSLSTRAC